MASSNVPSINDNNFKGEVLDAELPVLVDFTATWCGPCRALAPHLDKLADRFAGRARVVKLDIDSNQKTAAMYGVRSIPTLLVFKGGEPVDKLIGNPGSLRPLEQLLARNVDGRAAV